MAASTYSELIREHMDDVLIRVGLERKRPRPSAATTTRLQSHALTNHTKHSATASLESFIIQHVGVTSIHPTVEFHTVPREGGEPPNSRSPSPACMIDG